MFLKKRNVQAKSKHVLSNFNGYLKKFIDFFYERLCPEEKGSCEYKKCISQKKNGDIDHFDEDELCRPAGIDKITYEMPVENTPTHLIQTIRECTEEERLVRVCLNNSTCMGNNMYNNISRTYCDCPSNWTGDHCDEYEFTSGGVLELKEAGFYDSVLCFLIVCIIFDALITLYYKSEEISDKIKSTKKMKKMILSALLYCISLNGTFIRLASATLNFRNKEETQKNSSRSQKDNQKNHCVYFENNKLDLNKKKLYIFRNYNNRSNTERNASNKKEKNVSENGNSQIKFAHNSKDENKTIKIDKDHDIHFKENIKQLMADRSIDERDLILNSLDYNKTKKRIGIKLESKFFE